MEENRICQSNNIVNKSKQRRTDSMEMKRDMRMREANFFFNPHMDPNFRKSLELYRDVEEGRQQPPSGSHFKVIVSAHIVEVYEYEKPVQYGEKGEQERDMFFDEETGEIVSKESRDPAENARHNSRRAKNELRRLITANFDSGCKFATFTFRDGAVSDVRNVRECNLAFENFIKRMRRKYGKFEYCKVLEFQDFSGRGAVHYHCIMRLPYIRAGDLEKIWGNGFIKITRIDHVDNVGAYIRKYMAKDFDDERLAGEKAYSCSKGLIRPIVLYGDDAAEILDKYIDGKKEAFTSCYDSEYQGKITYREYNLQRTYR